MTIHSQDIFNVTEHKVEVIILFRVPQQILPSKWCPGLSHGLNWSLHYTSGSLRVLKQQPSLPSHQSQKTFLIYSCIIKCQRRHQAFTKIKIILTLVLFCFSIETSSTATLYTFCCHYIQFLIIRKLQYQPAGKRESMKLHCDCHRLSITSHTICLSNA